MGGCISLSISSPSDETLSWGSWRCFSCDSMNFLLGLFLVQFSIFNFYFYYTGMFPWAMLCTIPLFYYFDWPRAIFNSIPGSLRLVTPDDDADDLKPSLHCVYTKQEVERITDVRLHCRPSLRHHVAAVFSVLFITWQLFLPYSHFITKVRL